MCLTMINYGGMRDDFIKFTTNRISISQDIFLLHFYFEIN